MAKRRRLTPSLSVFFPCYNDAGSIGLLVKDAYQILPRLTQDFEIIVVDDGSRDESRKILRSLALELKSLKLVFHKVNTGYGGALKSGFKKASKQFVFYTDGDGQYDVSEITKLYEKLRPGVDIVQGYKLKRFDPLYRLIIGRVYHYVSKLSFGLKVRDVDCDFRLISKYALDKISLQYDSGVICVELVKKLQDLGFQFVEVGIHHYPRMHGHSQFFNYRRILKTLIELAILWFNLVLFPKVWPVSKARKF